MTPRGRSAGYLLQSIFLQCLITELQSCFWQSRRNYPCESVSRWGAVLQKNIIDLAYFAKPLVAGEYVRVHLENSVCCASIELSRRSPIRGTTTSFVHM